MQYPRGKNARPVSSAGFYPPDTRRPLVTAVESRLLKRPTMTTAIALSGPWTGLRAYPRGFRTPDSRQRMEAALERLQHHRERFDRHINRAQAAIEHIDRLCDDAIARLDASDPDADFEDDREADLCDKGEPSLCGIICDPRFADAADFEAEHDGKEPSLSALDRHGGNQCGGRWIGGAAPDDREDDDDGHEESEVGQ